MWKYITCSVVMMLNCIVDLMNENLFFLILLIISFLFCKPSSCVFFCFIKTDILILFIQTIFCFWLRYLCLKCAYVSACFCLLKQKWNWSMSVEGYAEKSLFRLFWGLKKSQDKCLLLKWVWVIVLTVCKNFKNKATYMGTI